MKYDLHIHSNISDGKLTREQIINLVLEKKLECIAFTEHNIFVPYNYSNVKIINGIEFDTFYNSSFHTVCYFKEYDDKIKKLIELYQQNTNDRSELLIKKMNDIYHIPISLDELFKYFNKKYITKRDIIDWLIDNKYAKTVTEAADTYTNKKAKSYVQKYSLPFRSVVDAMNNNGYVILAHPKTLKLTFEEEKKFIYDLKDNGLDGIEVINISKMNNDETIKYRTMAKEYNLITSGGSDFHSIDRDSIGIDGNDSNILIKKMLT